MFATLIAFFLVDLDVVNDPAPPRDLAAMAAWMQKHPADWLTAAEISDAALDGSLPRRVELWRTSYALALHLAPRLQNAPAAFVRDGLFHWYELEANDRKAVLDVAAPLLHDKEIFDDLHTPLWDLTHDFDFLLRNAPSTIDAIDQLRAMSASRGLFAEYRKTREALAQQRLATFRQERATMPPHELPSLLPQRLSTDDEPLVRAILEELHRQSFAPEQFREEPTAAMIEFALDHNLQPLEALVPFIEAQAIPPQTRARLALALGRADAAMLIELAAARPVAPEWVRYRVERALYEAKHGNAGAAELQLRRALASSSDPLVFAAAAQSADLLQNDAAAAQYRRQLMAGAKAPRQWNPNCGGNDVCDWARTLVYSPGSIDIDMAVVQSDRIPPYVEIYADDARVAEGEVVDARRFTLPLAPGVHRIEVRLVNPRIGSGVQRRVRLS